MSIFIRFIADGSFVSRAIGWRTDGRPSHVEYLITDTSGHPVRTFGARLSGGITHRPYDYCKPTFEEWYSFPGIESSYSEALKLDGRKYNWVDILCLLFGIFPKSFDPERLVCDQLVGYSNRMSWANGLSGVLINPNVPTEEMTPELLYGAVTIMVKKVL
jgi:hypothetical protein